MNTRYRYVVHDNKLCCLPKVAHEKAAPGVAVAAGIGAKGVSQGGLATMGAGGNNGGGNDAGSDDLETRDQVQQGVADTVWKVGCYKIK